MNLNSDSGGHGGLATRPNLRELARLSPAMRWQKKGSFCQAEESAHLGNPYCDVGKRASKGCGCGVSWTSVARFPNCFPPSEGGGPKMEAGCTGRIRHRLSLGIDILQLIHPTSPPLNLRLWNQKQVKEMPMDEAPAGWQSAKLTQ